MKFLGRWLIYPVLLSMLIACGKENESGKAPITFPVNPLTQPISPTGLPYSYQGVNVEQVLMQNPCINQWGGMPQTGAYTNQRTPIQIPLTGFPSQVAPNDIYVGVTSYGDVAVVAGQAPGQPPLFVAYLCPRAFTQQGTGQLMGVKIGAYTPGCLFKPITAATVVFPGGATAEFRWLDGGTSQRTRFAPPVCLQ